MDASDFEYQYDEIRDMRGCATTGSPEIKNVVISRMVSLLREKGFKGGHLEIGTAAGGTLKKLMLAYDQPRPQFVVIDPMTYFPHQYEIVKKNLLDAGIDSQEVVFHIKKSSEAYKNLFLSSERFDFILIDGAHKIKQVWQDLRFANMLNMGGILYMDDYVGVPQVRIPVDRFLANNPGYKKLFSVERGLFIEKTMSTANKLDILGTCSMLFINLFYQWRESYLKRLKRFKNR